MANFVLVLLAPSVYGLTELNRQASEASSTEVSVGWFLFWPGMLIVWGAAWLAFLVFAVRKNFRGALTAFLLTASLWFLPVAFYIVILIASA